MNSAGQFSTFSHLDPGLVFCSGNYHLVRTESRSSVEGDAAPRVVVRSVPASRKRKISITGVGSGRPSTASKILKFCSKRSLSPVVAAAVEAAERSEDIRPQSAAVLTSSSFCPAVAVAVEVAEELRPKIGGSRTDVVCIEGKEAFECDEGDILKVRYVNPKPATKQERELVNGIFVGRVLKFFKEAPKKRNGIVVERGGCIMIRLKWTDAPAGHLKVCRNKIDDFDKKTFEEC